MNSASVAPMFEIVSSLKEEQEPARGVGAGRPLFQQMMAAALAECREACSACEQACNACADACLGESELQHLARCIRDNLYCAEICELSARLLDRALETDVDALRIQLEVCASACDTCGAECRDWATAHGRFAATLEVCQRCAEQCRDVIRHLSGLATEPYGARRFTWTGSRPSV